MRKTGRSFERLACEEEKTKSFERLACEEDKKLQEVGL